mmetsp:Transcript_10135/g.24597  ORF Transcript_10135/g.24597 Transcript_10135/m.24597 type:complete len:319 (+) Transcript_10135:127-1083(+)|eukprot:CAMPEP_0197180070 /NCGR_PEP_ID=MMETSP1423-20130617/4814_1 /TAXON_ID=476441 /ORGANISM="Pseudo-nitzschia heimii, Strain UNC1101" /LENGTH=318 /DNA_ID=CAMNT_0042630091 /DNA_START=88 /DNA_END=1044 /DNA_ORIENTATION=-
MKFCGSILVASLAATASAFAPSSLSTTAATSRSSALNSFNFDPNDGGQFSAGGAPVPPPQTTQPAGRPSPIDDQFLARAPNTCRVQGDTLRTFDFPDVNTKRVQVGAEGVGGRPLNTRIEYWHTPSYIPFQVTAYSEDAEIRPVDCVIETPKHPKTIGMYNTGSQQMPLDVASYDTRMISPYDAIATGPDAAPCDVVQGGGMVKYYNFDPNVESIQVYIRSPEYNMKAKLEITAGPNSVRQTYEVYCSSGYKTPFYTVMQTPGAEPSTLRVINQNTVEFPFDCYVLPYRTGDAGVGSVNDETLSWGESRSSSNIMGQW